MAWYKENQAKNNLKKNNADPVISESVNKNKSRLTEKEKIEAKVPNRLLKETESSARRKQLKKNPAIGPEHPLLQHSEHRFEPQYIRRPDEDADSGIAMPRPPMAQKKSVFTIAYNDMHTSQIHDNTTATPP
ncbi:hypothetical protein HHI36_016881 [Cryptolaemus montrouzieri]|uniref:Uncharacterized protein n=1 Tax=Cryptolaemus montrouzieri TaxID=559131 RepID=A0ABD2NM09_9CUCU